MLLSAQYILSTVTPSVVAEIKEKILNNTITNETLDQLETTKEQIHKGYLGLKMIYESIHTQITFALSVVILSVAYVSYHEFRMLYMILATYLILALILRCIYVPQLETLSKEISNHE